MTLDKLIVLAGETLLFVFLACMIPLTIAWACWLLWEFVPKKPKW